MSVDRRVVPAPVIGPSLRPPRTAGDREIGCRKGVNLGERDDAGLGQAAPPRRLAGPERRCPLFGIQPRTRQTSRLAALTAPSTVAL